MQDPAFRPHPAAGEVQRALADVLADPALQQALRPRTPTWLDDIGNLWQRALGWLRDTVDRLLAMRQSEPALFWLLFVVLSAVALLLLAHIGWTLARAVRAPERARDGAEHRSQARAAHSRALRARAHALAERGELRQAVRHMLLAGLALAEERRLLAVANSWTIREILERLQRAPGAEGPAEPLMQRLENACYGHAEVSRDDFAAVVLWLDDLQRQERSAA